MIDRRGADFAHHFGDRVGITNIGAMQRERIPRHMIEAMFPAGQVIQDVNFVLPLGDQLADQFASDIAYSTGNKHRVIRHQAPRFASW